MTTPGINHMLDQQIKIGRQRQLILKLERENDGAAVNKAKEMLMQMEEFFAQMMADHVTWASQLLAFPRSPLRRGCTSLRWWRRLPLKDGFERKPEGLGFDEPSPRGATPPAWGSRGG